MSSHTMPAGVQLRTGTFTTLPFWSRSSRT